MYGFKKLGEQELHCLKQMRSCFWTELCSMPEGTLGTNKSNGKTYLRWWKKGRYAKNISMKKPEDIELARVLRRKRFLKEVISVIDNNIGLPEELLAKYIEFDPKGISDKLSKAYQIPPGKEKEVLPGFHPHSADAAEYRSKSEEIIALVLQSNGYRFMYECEIVANQRMYKPDFTIMDPRTNQLVYFEHFGQPDQPGYYEKMVRKLIDYWYEGIRIGKNLIVTFETKNEPLTTAQVQMALDQFFGTISK